MSTLQNYAKIGYYSDEFSIRLDSITLDMINRCLATGYNGILFELTVPVATDGSLQHNLHYEHMFALARQLQSQGINTGVLLNWNFNGGNASYVGQEALNQTRPAEFSMVKMLAAMDEFLRTMAPSAQASGLDLMVVGNYQPDFFASSYYKSWQTTLTAMRQTYTGKISVSVNSDDKFSPSQWPLIGIWDLLDEPTLWARPYISDKPLSDSAEILSAYFLSKLDGSTFVQEVIDLAQYTGKPVDLIFNAMAVPNAFDLGWDPTVAQALQQPLPVRTDLQALAYASFLQVVSQNLAGFVNTISLGNYEPWAVDPRLGQPPGAGVDPGDWALWNAFQYFDLSLHPASLHETLAQYFKGAWAGLVPETTYGSQGNDTIYTLQPKQTVRLMGGVDQCFGGPGQENYVLSPRVTEKMLRLSGKFWLSAAEDMNADVDIVHNGQTVATMRASNSGVSFKADTWTDVQTIEVRLSDASKTPEISLKFSGQRGIAEVTAMTLNAKPLDIHKGIAGTGERPTWSHDNWLSAGQELLFDLAGLIEKPESGQSVIDGGAGIDTLRFGTPRAQTSFSLIRQADAWVMSDASGQYDPVRCTNIERFVFSDVAIALDVHDNAGQVAKTLGAVFGKAAVTHQEYAGIGLHFVDDLNYSYNDLMLLAIQARLGANPSSAQVVDLLYTNVVGQAPDAATRKVFTDLLDNGTFNVGSLGVLAADTELNKVNINLVGLAQTGLAYLPFGG